MEQELLRRIGRVFGKDCAFFPIGAGHINDTFRSDDGKWILQRINTNVFPKPREVMENIEAVTGHIRKILSGEKSSRPYHTLSVVPALDGRLLAEDGSGCWRMYENIANTHSVEPEERTLSQFRKAGAAFGHFQRLLSDFPAEKLHETIADFHDTEKRLQHLIRAFESAEDSGRKAKAAPYYEDVLSRKDLASAVLSGIRDGSIPLAVTHNDTKINNVLFDDETDEAAAVVDLDTVMPGSRLYDFGDAIRSGAVTAAEDEEDASKVHFDPEAYAVFKEGYLSETADVLTEAEKRLLLKSAQLITYECGIRFLTDYLEGDVYFKTAYPEHNLVRARNQFLLLGEMLGFPEDL